MRLMYVEPIQAINVKHVVAKGEACTPPTFDHCAVAIHLSFRHGAIDQKERCRRLAARRRRPRREPSKRSATRYFAISFTKVGDRGFAPGQAVECGNARAAILRAKGMVRDKANAGSVAFSRSGTPNTQEYDTAVILAVFGKVPKDFDIG